jgi:catechol 2,3-dioxygenase-like lactoylglutathione lyase family enzyme
VGWDWNRIVFDHVHIGVRDREASMAFYSAALETLGIPPIWQSERGAQFANLVFTDDREPGGPVHIAFVAESREQVDAFHRAAIAAGGRDNGPPGVREHYSSEAGGRYYAAFVLDPDGNNIEAVHREF